VVQSTKLQLTDKGIFPVKLEPYQENQIKDDMAKEHLQLRLSVLIHVKLPEGKKLPNGQEMFEFYVREMSPAEQAKARDKDR
jgi:hypothetical protein